MVTGIRLKSLCKNMGKKLAAAGHASRVAILYLLAHRPMKLREISENIDLPENLVAHHVQVLSSCGWIRKRKQGTKQYYELKKRPFTDIKQFIEATPFGRTKESE